MLNGITNVYDAIYNSDKFANKALLNAVIKTETCYTYRIKRKVLENLTKSWNKTEFKKHDLKWGYFYMRFRYFESVLLEISKKKNLKEIAIVFDLWPLDLTLIFICDKFPYNQ